MKIKILLSSLLAALLLFPTGVFAAEIPAGTENTTPVIAPFLVSISLVKSEFQNNGKTAYAKLLLRNNTHTATLTATVQKKSGSRWEDTSYSWSSSAKRITEISKSISLSKGTYRIKAACSVKDKNGKAVESSTKYSSEYTVK